LLKRAGIAGASAVVPVLAGGSVAAANIAGGAQAPARDALGTLTIAERQVLEAAVARIIPTDTNGPGAKEACAARYIERALGDYLAPFRERYAAGLGALDLAARGLRDTGFAQLSSDDQDTVLKSLEKGTATEGVANPAEFFSLLRAHTIEGTFSDPYYGGNADFVGWDLIGYPGVRTMVTPDDQKMGRPSKPNHKSAYDFPAFKKAGAGPHPGGHAD
jgi:gluconate 2-dehydrogenase gamma chain